MFWGSRCSGSIAGRFPDVVILDGRAPDRYAHGGAVDPRPGHVPGARSAPAGANLADGRFRSSDELAQHFEKKA